MNNNKAFYQRNGKRLLKQARNRYHYEGGKEKAKNIKISRK